MTPGIYNNGIAMGNGAVVSMASGEYIVDGGTFSVQGGVTFSGTGVTIVLGKGTSGYATLDIGNGANLTLSAPTSGATAGLLFFQDPTAPTSGTNYFRGGANEIIDWSVVFPKADSELLQRHDHIQLHAALRVQLHSSEARCSTATVALPV